MNAGLVELEKESIRFSIANMNGSVMKKRVLQEARKNRFGNLKHWLLICFQIGRVLTFMVEVQNQHLSLKQKAYCISLLAAKVPVEWWKDGCFVVGCTVVWTVECVGKTVEWVVNLVGCGGLILCLSWRNRELSGILFELKMEYPGSRIVCGVDSNGLNVVRGCRKSCGLRAPSPSNWAKNGLSLVASVGGSAIVGLGGKGFSLWCFSGPEKIVSFSEW